MQKLSQVEAGWSGQVEEAGLKLGIVCVHYHAAALAERAVKAASEDARRAGLEVDAVIVDNGSTAEEAEALRRIGIPVRSQGNVGYAGGVNFGAELLPEVDAWLFMNPDVLVEDGCIEALVQELRNGAAVAGPRFFWDRADGFQLPPTESCGVAAELGRIRAAVDPDRATAARRSWRRHARRHWLASRVLSTYDLSGAMLAIQARAWHRVGPFDPGYSLYFEETDWLQRARALRERAVYVPDARAVHLYAQSTPAESRIARWFEESKERFRELHYGRIPALLLSRLESRVSRAAPPPIEPWPDTEPESWVEWVEISPSLTGFPAAGLRLEPARKGEILSAGLIEQMAPGTYFIRLLAGDEEKALYRFERRADPNA